MTGHPIVWRCVIHYLNATMLKVCILIKKIGLKIFNFVLCFFHLQSKLNLIFHWLKHFWNVFQMCFLHWCCPKLLISTLSEFFFLSLLRQRRTMSLLLLHIRLADIFAKGHFLKVIYVFVSVSMCTCCYLTFRIALPAICGNGEW